MKKIAIFTAIMCFSSVSWAEIVVDVLKIAGKSKFEVAAYLGKPSLCANSKYGLKCEYVKAQTEVVFIKGKADWITIEDIDGIPYSKDALKVLGLKSVSPSFSNDIVIRWESIQGLREVSIFKGSTFSDYAHIKTKTK